MVARLREGNSLKQSFYYNENKVKDGVAICLMAENYPRDLSDLTEQMRLRMLTKLAELRPSVSVNSLHISLNFDPSEKLSQDKLCAIAKDYMDRIGFGHQPYLVYEHKDAGHPHIHILTTNIEIDGGKIDLHKLGYRKSEPARKAIEIEFGLVKAEESRNTEKYRLEAVSARAVYGRTETKRAVQNVLQSVLFSYKYSCLPELNALLRLYNINADRGAEGTKMNKGNGLIYRVLDEYGKPIGSPIKASAFHMKPTLKFLDERYKINEKVKEQLKRRTKSAIDLSLLRSQPSLESLKTVLEKSGINLVIRQNEDGKIFGLTFVDHKNKVVFNGSELGKAYSAKAILERCEDLKIQSFNSGKQADNTITEKLSGIKDNTGVNSIYVADDMASDTANLSLWETLLQPEQLYEPTPYPFRLSKKKKRKKKISR